MKKILLLLTVSLFLFGCDRLRGPQGEPVVYLQNKTGINWLKIIEMRYADTLRDFLKDKNIPDFTEKLSASEELACLAAL